MRGRLSSHLVVASRTARRLPTGADLLEHYLKPLAVLPALARRIRLNTTAVAVARHHLDKVRSPGRDQLPFLVRVCDDHGRLRDLLARAVIDASGTWTQPNPLGASGLPALGEADADARRAAAVQVDPDVLFIHGASLVVAGVNGPSVHDAGAVTGSGGPAPSWHQSGHGSKAWPALCHLNVPS